MNSQGARMSIWHEGMELGHAEIDGQHRELCRRMEILVETCIAGDPARSVDEILDFLGEYVKTHFHTEEELMLRHGYIAYQFHKDQHTQFLGNLQFLKERAHQESKSADMALQINQMLIDWFQNHILNIDRAAVSFLASREG
jgi:hemerythrin